MMYKRYGKFRITDYVFSWIALCWIIVFVVVCYVLKLSIIYVILPILYLAALFYSIWNPNREYFEIRDEIIVTQKGRRHKIIKIPEEISLIFSLVDVSPPLSVRTAVGNETHILKRRYAVTILNKMDMDEIVEKVHRGYIKQYTTSTIKNAFEEHKYIYSFVYTDFLLKEILKRRNVNILIPMSLYDKVSLEKKELEIFIDPEC